MTEKFQEDQALDRLETDWLMEFYTDKCSVIRITKKIQRHQYTLHGQILAEETNTKHITVIIADNTMWNTHIEQTAAKRNKKLGFLKK